jgi:hypothetical protein
MDCVCRGLSTQMVSLLFPLNSSTTAPGLAGNGGAAFVWGVSDTNFSTMVGMTVILDGEELVPAYSTNARVTFSRAPLLNASGHAVSLNTSVTASPLRETSYVAFSIAAMPCVVDLHPLLWDPKRLLLALPWSFPVGADPTAVAVDALLQNFSLGPDAPWETIRTNIDKTQVFNLALGLSYRQCQPIRIALITRLTVDTIPDSTCSAQAETAMLSMSLPPAAASLVNVTVTPFDSPNMTHYSVVTYWAESADLGGCDDSLYTLTLFSIDTPALSISAVVNGSVPPPTPRAWRLPKVALVRGVEYMVTISVSTSGGQSVVYFPCHLFQVYLLSNALSIPLSLLVSRSLNAGELLSIHHGWARGRFPSIEWFLDSSHCRHCSWRRSCCCSCCVCCSCYAPSPPCIRSRCLNGMLERFYPPPPQKTCEAFEILQ